MNPIAALATLTFLLPQTAALAESALQPVTELEEAVYSFQPANNGAGPMWCHGSTCLILSGEHLFATGLETLNDAKPLNNCRWTLFQRTATGWNQLPTGDSGRTREPSPLAAFADGRIIVSANPTLVTNRETYSGASQPELYEFNAKSLSRPNRLRPVWEGNPRFSEHSYRSLASDREAGELILLQNIDYTHAEWSFLDQSGRWAAQGKLAWPTENLAPIRVCYPNVAIKNRAVHFCGTSDVVEPNEEWRNYKKQLTGQQWDYTFRRLFYTWTPDVSRKAFQAWVELANLDATAGAITLGDMWLSPDGAVQLLWTEHAIDTRLRDKFFPNVKQQHSLIGATLREGKIASRRVLLEAREDGPAEVPGRARFQVTPDNRAFVIFYVSGRDAEGKPVSENRVLELLPGGTVSQMVSLPLKQPMPEFFTATVRAGSSPSRFLHMLGPTVRSGNTISYARIRLY